MSSNWEIVKWGDIATLEYGKRLKGYKDYKGKYPVYGTNGLIGWTDSPLSQRGGVIIGRKGAYRGIHYSYTPFFVIDTAFYLNPNLEKVDPLWAYYELLTHDINRMDSGSAIPSTSRNDFYNLQVLLPPLQVQKKHVNVLNPIDEKIKINTSINNELEKLGEVLFRRWFIDFEFPDKNGKPYRSSGGNMIGSSLGDLPEKWKIGRFIELTDVTTDYVANGSFASLKKNVTYLNKPDYAILIRLKDYRNTFNGDFVYLSNDSYEFLKKTKLFGGEIIISNVGAYSGTVFKAPFLDNPMSLGPNAIMIKSNLYYHYLYYLLKSRIGQNKIDSIKTGSSQPKFNKTDLRNLIVTIPDNEVITKFSKRVNDISKYIILLAHQNRVLIKIQNDILPRLMSGEIRVPLGDD